MINTDRKYEKKNTERDSVSQDVTQYSIVASSLGFHELSTGISLNIPKFLASSTTVLLYLNVKV
jgi:hypothetical protein